MLDAGFRVQAMFCTPTCEPETVSAMSHLSLELRPAVLIGYVGGAGPLLGVVDYTGGAMPQKRQNAII
jgi:hypothetical protein